MGKLIWVPLATLLVPQMPVQVFFLFANHVVGRSHELDITRVVVTGLVVVTCGLIALGNLFGIDNPGLIEKYIDEQRRLRKQQEQERRELRARIDAEIGVPDVLKSKVRE